VYTAKVSCCKGCYSDILQFGEAVKIIKLAICQHTISYVTKFT